MKKIFYALMLSLLFVSILAVTVSAATIVDSGSCGDNVTYTLDSDGLLTISGSGDVTTSPWITSNSLNIKKVVVNSGIKSLCNRAFDSCHNLTQVSLPEGLERIKSYAFKMCYSLNTINFPSTLLYIDNSAFSSTGLNDITIPASVIEIGIQPFAYTGSIRSITVEEGNPNYSSLDGVLYNKDKTVLIHCPSQKRGVLTVPSTVKRIEPSAVAFSFIDSVVLNEGLEYIGSQAFYVCENISSLHLPSTLTEFNPKAFEGCSGLKSITVAPSNPNYMADANGFLFSKDKTAVYQCPGNVTSITIPSSVKTIEETFAAYNPNLASVIIPSSVTRIGWGAFRECTGLTSVTVPESVTKIENYAFRDCTNLTLRGVPGSAVETFANKNNIPFEPIGGQTGPQIIASGVCGKDGDNMTWTLDENGLLAISGEGEMADFSDAPWYEHRVSIKSLEIDDRVTSVGRRAFVSCDKLTSVDLGNGIKTIYSGAFQQCDTLEEIVLPNGLQTIEFDVFYGCDMLGEVTIPDSVKAIGNSAFRYCYALKSVTIGAGVEEIGSWAFSQGRALEKISVSPENQYFSSDENGVLFNKNKTEIVQYPIGSSATTYTIAGNIASICEMAFAGCKNITKFIVDEANINYICDENGVLFNKSKTELIQYPIGTDKFSYTIPNGVTRIGVTAFFYCTNVFEVVIPEDVTDIGGSAFYKCSSLETVKIHSKNATYGGNVLSSCHADLTLYGYAGSTAEVYANEKNIPFVDIETVDTYTVSFDANGGENAPEGQTKYKGISLGLTNSAPSRSDYKFKGWATSPDGEVVYKRGAKYTEDADITLYAVWEEITTKIGDPNGDGTVNMKDALILRKFLAGWTVEGDEAALDVNGDGSINMKDALILRKYLAGWNVELG